MNNGQSPHIHTRTPEEILAQYQRLGLDGIMARKSEATFFTLNKEIKLTSSWQLTWAILSHKNGFPSSVFTVSYWSSWQNTLRPWTRKKHSLMVTTSLCLGQYPACLMSLARCHPSHKCKQQVGTGSIRRSMWGLRKSILQGPALPELLLLQPAREELEEDVSGAFTPDKLQLHSARAFN